MPLIEYVPKRFSRASQLIIAQATVICAEYAGQGFDLTLRQLYYQFVARGLIPNRDTEYKRLGSIINDARLAGQLDWRYIVDRTRNLRQLSAWDSPADLVEAAAAQFRYPAWDDQPIRVEVWIEKDALVGVIAGVCDRNQVPYFSCRGYTSQSEVWGAAQRLERYLDDGAEQVVIIHLGDHDPSGIDMTRDIRDRLRLFLDGDGYDPDEQLVVDRVALTMDQVTEYDPPPNPAKLTDSRVGAYIARYGSESWELDALSPPVIDALIQQTIEQYRDADRWDAQQEKQTTARAQLQDAADRWADVVTYLDGGAG